MPLSSHPLNYGFTFADLYSDTALARLDALFFDTLRKQDAALAERLARYRDGQSIPAADTSELLIAAAPALETFVAELFGIGKEVTVMRAATQSHDPVFAFKKLFVQRRARRRLVKKDEYESFVDLDAWLAGALAGADFATSDRELAVARFGEQLLKDEQANADAIEKLTRWCVRVLTDPEAQKRMGRWVSFQLPKPRDHDNLVPIRFVSNDKAGRFEGAVGHFRRRDGFKLTDSRMGAREVQNEANYCIYCHDHDGDFCAKGFPEKKGEPDKGLKTDPLGVLLTGCPLDEKISEMNRLKRDGYTIGALAMIMVDNPMCPATGHRICNDCMKGCIYQKQDPVNIPEIETRCLTDVLQLPWGVEVYDLLTRWNPLRRNQYLPKPYNGLKVLITGMGPAGFTLAHHLLMDGFAVAGTEGLKIEPLARELIENPVRDWKQLEEALDTRVTLGFGGVAEYGITVRWDKNFLKLIYLSLLRRPYFQIFGGVRFGGTVTVEEAWDMGFDHLAIAVGAGLPQALPIPGSLARGMRQANDFLMSLQLTGAAKTASLANLQVRLPAVVIGGGLTGVDTATEVQAYYVVQVEKLLGRYEQLVEALGETKVRESLDEESRLTLDEYLAHGREVRAERARAARAEEEPDFVPLVRKWGGVTVAYRRSMKDSPAYTRNHEEITKAFEEGIYYAEGLEPLEARLDRFGHIEALECKHQTRDSEGNWHTSRQNVVLPARCVLVATGARPNVAYEFEHKNHFAKEKGHYQTHVVEGGTTRAVPVSEHCKSPDFGAFTSYSGNGHFVSFVGDTHPVFNGSVVRAVASGQRIYPKIVEAFGSRATVSGDPAEYAAFRGRTEQRLETRVSAVRRLAPNVVELTIHAPQAARRYAPGQFFRLQNFETHSKVIHGTRLHTEPLALVGTRVDANSGTVSMLVFERGGSSRLVASLKAGEPVLLMGPTGNRARIGSGDTLLLIGGQQAVATLLAIGPELRAAGSKVLFFATFESAEDLFLHDEIEAAADVVVYCTSAPTKIAPRRASDLSASGEIGSILADYASGRLGNVTIPLPHATRLQVVGGPALIKRIRDLRRGDLGKHLSGLSESTCSVHGMMQCMLKGVCSQCLQWQIDPATGNRTKAVFACSWQDEPMDIVDLDNVNERQLQNRLQEHLTGLWLDHIKTN